MVETTVAETLNKGDLVLLLLIVSYDYQVSIFVSFNAAWGFSSCNNIVEVFMKGPFVHTWNCCPSRLLARLSLERNHSVRCVD